MKTCRICGVDKDESYFYIKSKKTGTLRSMCKVCHSADAAKRFRHPPTSAARKRAYRKYKRFNLYGITSEVFNQMLLDQDGKCCICYKHLDKPFIDHDHSKGHVRGLLCHHCNSGLGMFRDNPEVMKNAIEYLRLRSGV